MATAGKPKIKNLRASHHQSKLPPSRSLQRLREVEKQFKRLPMEDDLLKKAIQFASQRKPKSSPSSEAPFQFQVPK